MSDGGKGGAARHEASTAGQETRWTRTKANVKTIAGAVTLAMFIRIVLFEAFEIEGPSMEPTLLNGDRVVVAKFMFGLFLPFMTDSTFSWAVPTPGDVVIVKSPADDIDIVKRVIGIPGDTIEIQDDVLYRNGEPISQGDIGACVGDRETLFPDLDGCTWTQESLLESDYRTSHSVQSAPTSFGPTVVPTDHIFILGDHRDRSNDSRYFGAVPISRVKGRALFIYWSNGDAVRWDRLGKAVD